MPRKPRPLDRDLGALRDASLIVIASEDTHAVREYFSRFRPRRVQFRVLGTENGRSAPQHILDRLKAFSAEFRLDESDQLWYCGDTDHWTRAGHVGNLVQVIQYCSQAGYHVALSNPCFELWLLLHFAEAPKDVKVCEDVCRKLAAAAGGYSKAQGCRSIITSEMIRNAIDRAMQLDAGTDEFPSGPATRIYRILRLLIDRESIVIA